MKSKQIRLRLMVLTLLIMGISVLQISGAGAAVCISQSGNGDAAVNVGPVAVDPGTVINVTMTAEGTDGSAIAIRVNGSLQVNDVAFSSPHSVSYTVTGGGNVEVLLAWEYTGKAGNSYTLTIGCGSSGGANRDPAPIAPNLLDGRINNVHDKDAAAPVAIYEGSIDVYGIDPATSEGSLVIQLSDEEIEAAGVPSEANILLAEGVIEATGMPVRLYRLTTGEYLLMTFYANGTPYNFVWDDEGNKYHA